MPSERQGMGHRTQLSFFDDPPPPSSDQSTAEVDTDDVLAFLALMRLSRAGLVTIRALFSGLNRQLSKVWDEQHGDLVAVLQRAKIPQVTSVVKQIKQRPLSLPEKAQVHLEAIRRRSISLIFRDTSPIPGRCMTSRTLPLLVCRERCRATVWSIRHSYACADWYDPEMMLTWPWVAVGTRQDEEYGCMQPFSDDQKTSSWLERV